MSDHKSQNQPFYVIKVQKVEQAEYLRMRTSDFVMQRIFSTGFSLIRVQIEGKHYLLGVEKNPRSDSPSRRAKAKSKME